jgi:short-subunit dehydrogenase involved in D-alanine esterification of teichoic acids
LLAALDLLRHKAAVHSSTQSLRWQLRGTSTQVIDLIPPYVQTELMGAESGKFDTTFQGLNGAMPAPQ